jgi:malate dehydrogenase (oxaloacetate-decarboxylating)(NADP+)
MEVQADFALNPEMLKESFRFLNWPVKSQYFDFSNLDSANITYKLLKELNHVDSIGPIMLGMGKPVHIFQLEQVWKKWLIWLPLLLLMLKKSRRKKIAQLK